MSDSSWYSLFIDSALSSSWFENVVSIVVNWFDDDDADADDESSFVWGAPDIPWRLLRKGVRNAHPVH